MRPWIGWKVFRALWFAAIPVIVLCAPAIAADACFLTPMAAILLVGGGPLARASRAPATCKRCGAVVPT